jgi:hypothetical protein
VRSSRGWSSAGRTWIVAAFAAIVLVAGVVGVASAQQGGIDNPSVNAYVQVPPTVVGPVEPAPAPPPPAQEVAPATTIPAPPAAEVQGTRRSSPPAPIARAAPRAAIKHVERGTLPFTGLQLTLMTLAAFALVGLGLTLRRISRPVPA